MRFTGAPSFGPPAQEVPLEARLARLVERSRLGDGDERRQAREELDTLCRTTWSACWDVHLETADRTLANVLRQALGIAWAQEAPLVVIGRLVRVEHLQGGVVDHHDLILHFAAPPKMLVGEELAAEHRIAPTMLRIARGTSQDTWLCDLMGRELERTPGNGLFAFRPRDLRYSYGDGGAEAAFSYFEFQRLPPEAIRASEAIVGTRGEKR